MTKARTALGADTVRPHVEAEEPGQAVVAAEMARAG